MIKIVIITDYIEYWLNCLSRSFNIINYHQFTDLKDEMKIVNELFEIIITSNWKEEYKTKVVVLDKPIEIEEKNWGCCGLILTNQYHLLEDRKIYKKNFSFYKEEGIIENENETSGRRVLEGYYENELKKQNWKMKLKQKMKRKTSKRRK